jgi:hypothetical protein
MSSYSITRNTPESFDPQTIIIMEPNQSNHAQNQFILFFYTADMV